MTTSSVVVADASERLSDLQSRFVDAMMENGGKVGPAAIAAGAAHESYGAKLLTRKKVQEELERRVRLQRGSALFIAMTRLLNVVENSSDDRAAVQAAVALMDRFGMAVPKAPLIDARSVNMTGPQAQNVIADAIAKLVDKRAERLAQQPEQQIEHASGLFDA